MDSPKFTFVNINTLFVINAKGKMRQLFTPFNVYVLLENEHLNKNSQRWCNKSENILKKF